MKSNTQTKRTGGSRPQKPTKKANSSQSKSTVQKRSSPLVNSAVIAQKGILTKKDDGNKRIVAGTQLLGSVMAPSSSTFAVTNRFRINPGSFTTFRWCSQQAVCYEYYRFRKLVFVYVPYVAKTTTGSVMSSWDYDAADAIPFGVNEQDLFSNERSKESAIYDGHRNPASPSMLNRLYKAHSVMSDERFATSSQDEKTIDCAQLIIGVDTLLGTGTKLGKMFLEYEVELISPQMVTEAPNQGGFSLNRAGNLAHTTKPITVSNIGNAVLTQELAPLIQPAAEFSTPPSLPTATVGRFTRDFEGVLDTIKLGSAGIFNSLPNLYVGPEANIDAVAGSLGDILQTVLGTTSLTDTSAIRGTRVSAKAGDLLRLSLNDASAGTVDRFMIRGGGAFI